MNSETSEDKSLVAFGKYSAWALLVSGALIDIVSIKYPCAARSLFHIEMLQLALLKIIPVDQKEPILYGSIPRFYYESFMMPLVYSLCLSCDIKLSLCMLVLSCVLSNVNLSLRSNNFFENDEDEQLKQSYMIYCCLAIALVSLTMTIILGLLNYISDLHS